MVLNRFALLVGVRYSFSRKRNRFTSVIALISMLGMVLGVASLITVLSVMNGFGNELRGRILSLVAHGYVEGKAGSGGLEDWETLQSVVEAQPGVVAVSPYIADKVIISGANMQRGGLMTAIDPGREARVSRVTDTLVSGSLAELDDTPFAVVMGAALARMLRVQVGDRVEVTVPRLTVTPLGVFPRSKRLIVVGLFEVGAQADAYQLYVSLATGQKLLGEAGRVDGLQVRTVDLFSAPATMSALRKALPAGTAVKDWSQTQGSLFRAVKMEKIMVSLLLLSVVAVAAFNIVSTLVMSVAEKRGDIAVLRTMGARAGSILAVFVAHGLALAMAGIGLGALFGVLLSVNIATIAAVVENALGLKLFDPSVYFISELPAELRWPDVLAVVACSLLLSLFATLYPAWRASRIAPAEVLRYE